MTQRRPHWDDELIDAVRYVYNLQMHYADEQEALDSIYDVIAVVEDWEKETFVSATAIVAERIEKAETAIQRVRELCQSAIDESYLTDASIARAGLANRILRALDGAS